MRGLLVGVANVAAATALLFFAAGSSAQAKIAISVDKDAQQMTVAVDGVERYTWPVSTGNPSHETPNGKFQTFRMEEDHFSKEFDDAPMPHAIFFTKSGHAIHGTDSVSRLGTPVSHGCVRLSRANATTLWDLVKSEGVLNTSVTLTGSSQVALARNPRATRSASRRDAAPASAVSPDFDAAGNPISLAPQASVADAAPRRILPRRVAPATYSGYTYSDGSEDLNGYAAPRGYRRYDAQGNSERYYVDRGGYAQQDNTPQVYAPRPQPYQARGFFGQD